MHKAAHAAEPTDKGLPSAQALNQALNELKANVVSTLASKDKLGVVGIQRGGVVLAGLLGNALSGARGKTVHQGTVDIGFYRDDAGLNASASIGPTHINFNVEGRDILLVDDVLYTGRTIRAAIDAVLDYGRPNRIWLAVLVDRGGRELPIAADFCGMSVDGLGDARLKLSIHESGDVHALLRLKGGQP